MIDLTDPLPEVLVPDLEPEFALEHVLLPPFEPVRPGHLLYRIYFHPYPKLIPFFYSYVNSLP